jgi:hypothetical protein
MGRLPVDGLNKLGGSRPACWPCRILDSRLRDFARHCVGLGLIGAGIDDDVGAFAGKFQRRGPPDIAAGAGDQSDLSVELTHQRISMTMFEANYRASVSRLT